MNIKGFAALKELICVLSVFLFLGASVQAQTVFRGKVLDGVTQKPIEGAKIGISDQGVGLITNEKGLFNYRKYHQTIGNTSKLLISAKGYETIVLRGEQIRALYNKSSKFALAPAKDAIEDAAPKPIKNVVMFWDASLSSINRDFKKEWDLLESYLQDLGAVNLSFVAFNESIIEQREFAVNGDVSKIIQLTESLEYTGSTSYEILDLGDADLAILLSDGNHVLGEWDEIQDVPYHAITSLARANENYLKSLATYTSGVYINLSFASVAQGLDQIKRKVAFLEVEEGNRVMIEGIVKTTSGPIQGASITIKGDLEEFVSKSDGSFNVPAQEGDVLQVKYLGMYTKEMLVENPDKLEVELIPLEELLDEVVLKAKRKKSKQTSDTGFGEKSIDEIGVSVNTITSKDIRINAQSLADVVRGRFAGVTVAGFGDQAVFSIRGGNSNQPAIWVVDGSIFQEIPTFVDPQNVHSISILKSIQATGRYGSIASGGAFIVKTKAYGNRNDKGEIEDIALVKGNDYDEQIARLNLEALKPNYVKQIEVIEGKEAQYQRYQDLVPANTTNATFFIDMALYFQSVYPEKAKEIRYRLAEVAQGNPEVLRVLGYLYDNAQDYESALRIYERVLQLSPGESQSYRDLAQTYERVGLYDKALELYINMLSEQILGVDFSHIERPLGHELLHLATLHRDEIEFTRLPEEWLRNEYRLDLRMVIEWSNRDAPFEFQFVNPQDKYFKWNHSIFENKDRLQAELKAGFQFEEFVIDEAPHGLWLVNIEYLGKDDYVTIPPYLKYTIYRDYGTREERAETIIIKLTKDIGRAQLHEFLL